MDKSKWGLKRQCHKCGAFFYDMGKPEFVCPKCGVEYTVETYEQARAKHLAKMARKAAPKLDDEDLNDEALLNMTSLQLTDEDDEPQELDISDEENDLNSNDPDLTDIMENFEDEGNG